MPLARIMSWASSRLVPVHTATSPADREAVARFRYRVFVDELGKPVGNADHGTRRVDDPIDDDPAATHLYAGTPDALQGVMRVLCWGPGQVDAQVYAECSMDRFPGIDGLAVCELGRGMVSREARGGVVLLALIQRAVEVAAAAGSDLLFLFCVPNLVPHYQRLGARPFGGRTVPHDTGLSVPMVVVLTDVAHLRHVGSPLHRLVKRLFGHRPPLDTRPFAHLLADDAAVVELECGRVEAKVASSEGADRTSVFDGLSPASRQRLFESCLVLEVAEGDPLTQAGMVDREVYVVLNGLVAVEQGGVQFALLGPGDVFGEVAFFSSAGRRTAEVRALSAARVSRMRCATSASGPAISA